MNKKKILTLLLTIILVSCLVNFNPVRAEPAERFKGYNLEKGKWVVGNLGKDYVEGDFVSYQLKISEDSKLWGATEFHISFNFHQPSSGAIYVDGFDTSVDSGFQYCIDEAFLPDGTQVPTNALWPSRTHIPTPEAGESMSDPHIANYMNPWPPLTPDSESSPAKERYFTVKNLPWPADGHIILFFRAHLALDIIWSAGFEAILPQWLDGDEFEAWTKEWKGSSFATGSSRHFYLQVEGVGAKTIPIPIVQYPMGRIYGCKLDACTGDPLDDWEINLRYYPIIGLEPIEGTVLTVDGFYAFNGLPAGNYEIDETVMIDYTFSHIWTTLNPSDYSPITNGISFLLEEGGNHRVNFFNRYTPSI
jgi:hypothetical protein